MINSYAMTAAHLLKFQTQWSTGVPYHFTYPDKVQELVDLVTRAAEPLSYDTPTCGTAFLRLNYIIKEAPNKESWQYGGGALTSNDVTAHIERLKTTIVPDGKELKDTQLTAWIVNEWERFSIVFELVLIVGDKRNVP